MSAILFLWMQLCACSALGLEPGVVAQCPIESDGDALTVEVVADGQPLRLVLNTGTRGLQLDAAHSLCRGNDLTLLNALIDKEEKFQAPIRGPRSLKLGDAVLDADQPAYAVHLMSIRKQITQPANGMVGLDPFHEYVLEFDWDVGTLRVRENVPANLTEWVPLRWDDQYAPFPVIHAVIPLPKAEGAENAEPSQSAEPLTEEDRLKALFEAEDVSYPVKFLLSSNWCVSSHVMLATAYARRLRDKGALVNADPQGRLLPVDAPNTEFTYLLNGLAIGNRVESQLRAESTPDNHVNILPICWMSRYHLAIDLPRRRLYLGSRKGTPPPLHHPNLTGLTIESNPIPQDRGEVKVFVADVAPDSVAAKAGLRKGDRILSFNGRTVGKFRPFELIVAQQFPETEYSLRIVRGTEPEFDAKIRVPAWAAGR